MTDCNSDFKCQLGEEYTREEMLDKIRGYKFSIIELALYLDTHVDDEKALCLHNEYCKKHKELCDKSKELYNQIKNEHLNQTKISKKTIEEYIEMRLWR